MDRLDKYAWTAIVLLLAWGGFLVVAERNAPAPPAAVKVAAARPAVDPQLEKRIELVKNLLLANNVEKAEALLGELLAQSPYEGVLYLLKGDAYLYRQQPVAAMGEYRKAVELSPDLLEKTSKNFQGKKIKKTVEEARKAVDAALSANPGDSGMREHRTTVYYMLRLLAGSCG